jgi:photosystem II stability/assembly factor-like uncharacterized protein
MTTTSRHPIGICFAILLSCVATVRAHVPHDIIYSLDVSPTFSEDGLVLASSTQFGEGHLISSNYGETFSETHAGMKQTLVTGHAFSPNFRDDGVVYTVTKSGYYRSSDRGRNWKKQKLASNRPVLSVCTAPDFASSNQIYVLTANALHKVNGSSPFTVAAAGATEEPAVSALPLKKFEGTTFGSLQTANGRLFMHRVYYDTPKKKNGMELVDYASGSVDVLDLKMGSWSPLSGELEGKIIADFDVSVDGDTLVVALKDGTVHISNDRGATWDNAFHRDEDFFCKVKLSPDYDETHTICAATTKGFVFLSGDGGETWETRSNGLSRWVHHVNILVNKLVFSPNYNNDNTIFLGKTTGFYKTTDNGQFWRHINVWNPKWGYFVYPAPGKDSKDVFTATYNSGISRSHDLGETWSSANVGITSAFANGMELSPNYAEDKSIFVMDIVTGLYQSSDAGRSWSKIKEMDTAEQSGNLVLYRELGISSDFKDDGLILVFSVPRRTLDVKDKHCFTFNVKTKELKRVMIGSETNYINDFAFSPTGSKQKMMFAGTAQGAFVSRDSGDTWQNMHNTTGGVASVIVSPDLDNDGTIFLKSGRGGLLVSKDLGKSFQPTELALTGRYIQNLVFSPDYATDHTLYATTYGAGVFRSRDAGKTWKHLGLRGKWLYSGPSFSANYSSDKTMFAPAVDGIYRSTDDGATWANVLDRTQFLPKVPFLTLKDSDGREIPLSFGTAGLMKKYGAYDEEVGEEMFRASRRAFEKVQDPRAYLASYYKFRVDKGSAVEVYFFGTSVEYKCVQGSDMGIVDIELDGKLRGQFDLYSAQENFDVTGFLDDELEEDAHMLRIIATGEKNPASSGKAFTFNAANIKN